MTSSSSELRQRKGVEGDDSAKQGVQGKDQAKYAEGTNWVAGGVDENPYLFGLVVAAPFLSLLLSYVTSEDMKASGVDPYLTSMIPACVTDLKKCGLNVLNAGLHVTPTAEAAKFILCFMAVGFLLEFLPGNVETGPETLTGHIPKYVDNGVRHCIVFSIFFCGRVKPWTRRLI